MLKNVIETNIPIARRFHLIQMCQTRWVERHDAILVFWEMIELVMKALTKISSWEDRDSSINVNHLICAMKQMEFFVALHVLAKVFSISLPLSRILQTENIDLCTAMDVAISVESIIKTLKQNNEYEFSIIFRDVKEILKKFNLEESSFVSNLESNQLHYFRLKIFG